MTQTLNDIGFTMSSTQKEITRKTKKKEKVTRKEKKKKKKKKKKKQSVEQIQR